MTDISRERWESLMKDDSVMLTDDEIAAGWHFCSEFDGLLLGPGWYELRFCTCLDKEHPARKVPWENPYICWQAQKGQSNEQ